MSAAWNGESCPKCGHWDVESQGLDYPDPQAITSDITCNNCGHQYIEVYEIHGRFDRLPDDGMSGYIPLEVKE